jgi:hypothetical protein
MTGLTMAKKALMVAATIGVTLVGTAGMASAGSSSGGCAANMVNTHKSPEGAAGMVTAMTANNPNGSGDPTVPNTKGMYGAINASCS